jgi:formyltetrahydrofolate hydrolase
MPTLLSETAVTPGKEPGPAATAASKPHRLYILTTVCPDTTGIVAAIAGFLAANNGLITEAQHHDDPHTRMSFMRTAFHDSGQGMR